MVLNLSNDVESFGGGCRGLEGVLLLFETSESKVVNESDCGIN